MKKFGTNHEKGEYILYTILPDIGIISNRGFYYIDTPPSGSMYLYMYNEEIHFAMPLAFLTDIEYDQYSYSETYNICDWIKQYNTELTYKPLIFIGDSPYNLYWEDYEEYMANKASIKCL